MRPLAQVFISILLCVGIGMVLAIVFKPPRECPPGTTPMHTDRWYCVVVVP